MKASLQDKEWEKELEFFYYKHAASSRNLPALSNLKDFIRSLLFQQEQRIQEKYKGNTKRVWFMMGAEEGKEMMKRELRKKIEKMKSVFTKADYSHNKALDEVLSLLDFQEGRE